MMIILAININVYFRIRERRVVPDHENGIQRSPGRLVDSFDIFMEPKDLKAFFKVCGLRPYSTGQAKKEE